MQIDPCVYLLATASCLPRPIAFVPPSELGALGGMGVPWLRFKLGDAFPTIPHSKICRSPSPRCSGISGPTICDCTVTRRLSSVSLPQALVFNPPMTLRKKRPLPPLDCTSRLPPLICPATPATRLDWLPPSLASPFTPSPPLDGLRQTRHSTAKPTFKSLRIKQ